MKKFAALLLLLLPLLTACALCESAAAATPPAQQTPEPTPAPSPAPEILTHIRLKRDPLPEGFRMLDYAACSNSTMDSQTYVDTGVSPSNETRFYLDFACASGFTVKDTWFFGCFNRESHMYMEVGYHQGQGNDANFYTATGVHYSQTEDSAARTVAWLRPGDYFYPDVRNGVILPGFTEPVEQHLFLFSRQHTDMTIAGTHDVYGHYDLRIYGCRIWDKGEPVRDYVACLSPEDGRTGMYDLTEGRVYYSAGSDELIPGEESLPEAEITAINGIIREPLENPALPGFVFEGYFTGYGGSGEQIIDAKGQPCANVAPEEGLTLYAHWTRDEAYFDRY